MLRTLDDLQIKERRVLVRADLNVPIKDGKVTDSQRIRAAAPTIREIVERGGTPVVMSHLGKPKGERDPSLSLRQVADELAAALDGIDVVFAENYDQTHALLDDLEPGKAVLIENLRFHSGEKDDDEDFAKVLAGLGDAYVDDAFSAAHRAHASIVGLPKLLPCAAGRLMEREIRSLEEHLADAQRPFAAIVGGAKISSKFGLLRSLISRVDTLVLAGGMANTLLAMEGKSVGKSIREDDARDEAREISEAAREHGCEIVLPSDVVVAREMQADAPSETVSIDAVPDDAMILDLGPDSIARIREILEGARTLVWNGPLGAAEVSGFERATHEVAKHVAERTRDESLISVAGGGETGAALAEAGVRNDFTYVSLAGGAFLEWLEGKELPGVEALRA